MRIDPIGTPLYQSPFLYLQSAGSTGGDGSSKGVHLRWHLLRNLGDNHLPKGNYQAAPVNFNKPNDFVGIYRTPYNPRFYVTIDLRIHKPTNVFDVNHLWVFNNPAIGKIIYFYFREAGAYNSARSSFDPQVNPMGFMQKYGAHQIDIEVKDDLFFAAEIYPEITGPCELLVEGVSVEDNLPLSDRFVSCRKRFKEEEMCEGVDGGSSGPGGAMGNNLLGNPGFEKGNTVFQSQYQFVKTTKPGHYSLVFKAGEVSSAWSGQAHSGETFMAVSSATSSKVFVWRESIKIDQKKTYCFSGYVSSLSKVNPSKLEIRCTVGSRIVGRHFVDAPPATGQWKYFECQVPEPDSDFVTISIYSLTKLDEGNDFGLDDLHFGECEGTRGELRCGGRLVSENMQMLRFTTVNCHLKAVRFECYQDFFDRTNYHSGWEFIGDFALTTNTGDVFDGLDNASIGVHGAWQKFNDGASVNTSNYEDRWNRPGGLKQGVQEYFTLSDNAANPQANTSLSEDSAPVNTLDVSYLNMLQLSGLDFHVARMLGMGTIDNNQPGNQDTYIYVAVYKTLGGLSINTATPEVTHYYMSLPTARQTERLPDTPKLLAPSFGLFVNNGTNEGRNILGPDGYTPDGQTRYVNFHIEYTDDNPIPIGPFFVPSFEFCSSEKTDSLFVGLEYRMDAEPQWRKPELSHDDFYKDASPTQHLETQAIVNPNDENVRVFVHQQKESGTHRYTTYGINIFSRASALSPVIRNVITTILPANTLIPPTNFKVHLVQSENPLILTTAAEQVMLAAISGNDKTLVRVTFDYHHTHDITYAFGDRAEFFFREDAPLNVTGAIKSVTPNAGNPMLSIVRTESYLQYSAQNPGDPPVSIDPVLAVGDMSRFEGGVFVTTGQRFVVQSVQASGVSGEGPIFTVINVIDNEMQDNGSGGLVNVEAIVGPTIVDDGIFMSIENMADAGSWGGNNPVSKQVQIGDASWTSQVESIIQDGETTNFNLRGVWDQATIADIPDATTLLSVGVYAIEFDNYILQNHPQSTDLDPVNWYKGVVRVSTVADPTGAKKVLEVMEIQHLGDGQKLRLIAFDANFPADAIQLGSGILTNYYPGYRLYLYEDAVKDFSDDNILPAAGEGTKQTFMGTRSLDTSLSYHSPVSVPQILLSHELIEPLQPELPVGAEYATRPDFYNKSTYTFKIPFRHQPFAAAFYRVNEEDLLGVLYQPQTILDIRDDLAALQEQEGGDPYYAARWKNLVGLTYVYNNPASNEFDPTGTNVNGAFRRFPREDGYRFPKPDIGGTMNGSQEPGDIIADVKVAVYGAFTPLTEQPLFYSFINGSSYVPIAKKQNIRGTDGKLLSPTDPDFDQAPMAKKSGTNEIQFTDFTLDGASTNIYFYCAREIGNLMKLGDPSPILGPILLVDTTAPEAPEIKRMTSLLPDAFRKTGPMVDFEINSYDAHQNIRSIQIYRTLDPAEALSVRNMELVKTVDLEEMDQLGNSTFIVQDTFDGISDYPFGESIFYRLVALRAVEYINGDGILQSDVVPSKSSQTLLTNIVDAINPNPAVLRADIPTVTATELQNVRLEWDKVTHNANYHLYKRSKVGNWQLLNSQQSNDTTIDFLLPDPLSREDEDGNRQFHHFKVTVENSAGLLSLREKVLTL